MPFLLLASTLVTWPLVRRWVSELSGPAQRPSEVRWNLREVAAVLFVHLAVLLLLAMGVAAVGELAANLVAGFLVQVFAWGVTIAAAMAAIHAVGGAPWADLMGGARTPLRAALLGLGSWFLLEPALLGFSGLWTIALDAVGVPLPAQPILSELLALDGFRLALSMAIAVVVIPLCEELVFRSFLQGWLVRELGVLRGILVTSVIFGLLHGHLYAGPILVLSLFLGWLRWRTDSLAACWTAHGLHNGLVILLATL